ncbi:MAG: lipase family protein, partial [Nitrococcus sp.]|nr:lipase family protein [Nitrococcus sp.]
MLNKQAWLPTIAVLAILTLCGCTPPKQYHTVYKPICVSATPRPSPECETHALQRLPTASEGNHYLLGFIEFDDQGQLWDRQQMSAVVNKLIGEAANKNLLMVVFVHGWKHNAAPDDANVATFREMLRELTDAEVKLAKGLGTSARAPKRPPREIVGVYIGWRGASVTLPLIKELTFWDRKNTAQKVGRGGVTEVLSRLESIKRVKQHIGESGHTRLVIVGHSFGGAVVYTALSHILENRFVRTTGPAGEQSDVGGFGDLVVLINPALEA